MLFYKALINFKVPKEHKAIVKARIKEFEENPDSMLDWDVVSQGF